MAVIECKSSQAGVQSKLVEISGITDKQVQEAHARLDSLVASMPSPSDAVAVGYLAVIAECPDANPSDLWQHVVYRRLLDNGWSDNKWKRVSGFALERALLLRYNPLLANYNVRMRMLKPTEANTFLATLGTDISSTKVDIFIEGQSKGAWKIFGATHVKSSIAERIQDDVPASQVFMRNGLVSILVTMDSKSYPPPHGEGINYGELGGRSADKAKARIKRDYIEKTGQFDALFSFNLRTPPSPPTTASGKRIHTMSFSEKQPDQLVRFLSSAWSAR